MTAILKSVEDPRDQLERARRYELVSYARANGMAEINADMPAILIRRKLRARGFTRPPIPNRILGMPERSPAQDVTSAGPDIDAADDLERQFARPAISVVAERKPLTEMTLGELNAEMKRLGIKRERRDNMVAMRAKIEAHG